MSTLTSVLRRQLEKAVEQARVAAELGARQSLEALAVHHHEPWAAMDSDQRALRRRLRAHGRQLGDVRNSQSGRQDLDRLTEEVAYEFWHRMLFARFLAENDLLMYPDPDDPVALSLEECEQLAGEEGAANGWELAARFAARMLPQIFRLDSPVFQLALPPEHQQRLERLAAGLPAETFSASDSLGWVYQFWQSRKRQEVNAAGGKIGATELPAVTQLFTEPYMVSFLLDNSLGAWWAARRLTEVDLRNASSEEELRRKAAIPGVPLEYLRFAQQEDGTWTPAAGTFDGWPEQLADLKTLDPCCGSGHFLVAAFLMLAPIRMERDGLSAKEAVDAVLQENIHGLELDQRCVELAAFALALTAWKYPAAGGYRVLPELNLACSGSSISAKKEEVLALAGDNANLRLALEQLYKRFKDAPVLGSLINPEASLGKSSLFELKWGEVSPMLTKALMSQMDDVKAEVGVAAKGVAKAAELLSIRYHWVITNVPFLGFKRQGSQLRTFCEANYPVSESGLETVFIERIIELCGKFGIASFVSNQTWLFQPTSRVFRKKLLGEESFSLIARLGAGAFETITGQVVNVCLALLLKQPPTEEQSFILYDLQEQKTPPLKSIGLLKASGSRLSQNTLLKSSDSIISSLSADKIDVLSAFSSAASGLKTGDRDRFNRRIWEVSFPSIAWDFYETSSKKGDHFTGMNEAIFFQNDKGELAKLATSLKHLNHVVQNYKRGQSVWKRRGVAVSATGKIKSSIYTGDKFDSSVTVLVPVNDESALPALLSYCQSGDFEANLRKIDSKLSITTSTTIKVPFDIDHWTKVAEEEYPNGLPKPYSDDPTQWIFHGHPCGSVVWDDKKRATAHGALRTDETVLQVAVGRLLGYRWPPELDTSMELAGEQREWVARCKYLLSYADGDGIVCIQPVRGEAAAADRLRRLLAVAYGDVWSDSTERELLAAASGSGKPCSSFDQWLRERFFEQHCKLFHNRPFIWHIWDGRKDGFHALVNYHRLAGSDGEGRRTLEALTYGYLGEWISRQRADQKNEVEGADARLASARTLQTELEKILEGEPPYDLFIRWKPLHEQPVGWNPDINDGVRLNIRPFVLVADVGRKGAGILRARVDNAWTNTEKVGVKDRGKEVESMRPREDFPWFWGCNPEKSKEHQTDFGAPMPDAPPAEKKFDGLRWNNLHYTRAAREAARVRKDKKD